MIPEWKSWAFWRLRLMEIATAVVIAIGVIYFTTLFNRQWQSTVPPNAWIAVNEVLVPDHVQGEDPLIIYDRVIRQDFPGMWVVEVQKEEPGALFSPACVGSGIQEYRVETILPDRRVALSWFLGRDCALEPGRYRLRATWTIQLPDWPEKKTSYTSAIFSVHARGTEAIPQRRDAAP